MGGEIVLSTGFIALNGFEFLASIKPCIGGCDAGVGRMANNESEEIEDYKITYSGNKIVEENETLKTNEATVNEDFIATKIFPNPATNNFTYQTELNIQNSTFVITNLLGQRVYSKTVIETTNETNFDINEIPNGIYFLSHYSAGSKLLSVNKIIKE